MNLVSVVSLSCKRILVLRLYREQVGVAIVRLNLLFCYSECRCLITAEVFHILQVYREKIDLCILKLDKIVRV